MKMTSNDIMALNNLLNVCSLVNIDMVLIKNEKEPFVSGVNPSRTSVIFGNGTVVPAIESDKKLGLTKLKTLKQRLDIFKSDENISIETKEKENGDIFALSIKGSSASVEFRTQSPNSVKCPVAVEDTDLKKIFISKTEAQLILNGEKAMGSDKLTISINKNDEVSIQMVDTNNEVFEVSLSTKAETLDDSTKSLTTYMHTDVFSPVLKAMSSEFDNIAVIIAEASIRVEYSGFTIVFFPPVDNY
jgi:hypothetical protein